jgi:hypothetical protein
MESFERYLAHPPREPEYRQGRNHLDFCTCLSEYLERDLTTAEVASVLIPELRDAIGVEPEWLDRG